MIINSGESIGIVGPSGSGKTTLLDVLLGLLHPQNGKLFYNGKPLQESINDWYSQVAYLPQEIFLIDNTLRCNVALGVQDSDIDDSLVKKALNQSELNQLLLQLPKGINTMLGEKGVRLSGGQRQRVALARAFYHKRKILILDEATSSLDHKTEEKIVKEINRLKGYSKAVNIRPDLKNGWRKLAKVYRSQDKTELLIMALSRILEIDSEDQAALWERAESHFEEKKLGDSMGDIHHLLALNPGNQKARKFKAKILEKLDTREWD